MKVVRSALETNLSLKCISFVLGFFCWFIFSNTHHSSLDLEVPVSFFGDEHKKADFHPEILHVHLSGKRSDLYALNPEAVALHVNLDELEPGEHLLEVSAEKLLLPAPVKLVHWNPINPLITVTEDSNPSKSA